ncbi:MAG TPA: DUF2796 domain-containing protein [Burkholderiaceae bacterium]
MNKRLTPGLLCALACMAQPVRAHEPGAHVHGMAELRVAIDAPQLEISLESPLDNVLGFEHAPRDDKQRAAVRVMAARLRQAQTLFVPTPAAHCRLTTVQLASAALPADLLGEKPAASPEASHDADGHADLDATFTFSCAAPSLLKGMDVDLMQAFAGFHKINVSVAGPAGQSSVVLTPGTRTVRW